MAKNGERETGRKKEKMVERKKKGLKGRKRG